MSDDTTKRTRDYTRDNRIVSVNDRTMPKEASARYTRRYKTLNEEAVSVLIERVAIHLREGNFEAATSIIESTAAIETDPNVLPGDTPLAELMDTRFANFFENEFGVTYAGQAIKLRNHEIRAKTRTGVNVMKAMQELDGGLARIGLRRVA